MLKYIHTIHVEMSKGFNTSVKFLHANSLKYLWFVSSLNMEMVVHTASDFQVSPVKWGLT